MVYVLYVRLLVVFHINLYLHLTYFGVVYVLIPKAYFLYSTL